MVTKIIEATNRAGNAGRDFNWGKFLVGRFDREWYRRTRVEGCELPEGFNNSLLSQLGIGLDHLFVLDLQTCEGAIFVPGGLAKADLAKHHIWVCPLFEPFLTWIYTQDLTNLAALPDTVDLNEPGALSGYRREGRE